MKDVKRCILDGFHARHGGFHARLRRQEKSLLVLAAGAIALIGLLMTGQVVGAESRQNDPEAVARAWVEALNGGDAEGAISLYADDAVILFLGKEVNGRQAIAERQRTTITGTLKPSLKVEDLTVQGDTVKVSLLGENGITRFDGHEPVHAVTTLTIQDGKIVKEVGPVLGPEDAAWYAATSQRFLQSQRMPSRLPQTGEDAGASLPMWTMGTLGLGALFIGLGLLLRLSRPRALGKLPGSRK